MIQAGVKTDKAIIGEIFLWFLFLPALLAYVLFYRVVFLLYLKYRSILRSLTIGLTLSILVAVTFTLFLELRIGTEINAQRVKGVMFELFLFNVFLCMVVGSIAFILRVFHEWFKDQKFKEELMIQNHNMELKVIKSQLDPHFLFNSLNNIDVLIQQNASKASDYLNRLSTLLRYTLNPSKSGMVRLVEEVEYIKNYISLQKIRSSKADLVQFTVKGDLDQKQLYSMLFIPFIENAFKHHQYTDESAQILIQLEVQPEAILFTCSNHISKKTSNTPSFQLGNKLVQKRLHLLYPNQHELNFSIDDNIYLVKLQLK